MSDFERPTQNSARATRRYPVSLQELESAVEKAVENLPHWQIESRDDEEVKAVRQTRIFRFKDDVSVSISSADNGSEAHFHSASRIGKGDMGQNPRNLRELLQEINEQLG